MSSINRPTSTFQLFSDSKIEFFENGFPKKMQEKCKRISWENHFQKILSWNRTRVERCYLELIELMKYYTHTSSFSLRLSSVREKVQKYFIFPCVFLRES